ncbi:MAG: hypothetical protein IMF19_02660 [Proteobacteria bacterium]|nr:hypothetical protein [Pseudomonadota bacterium]
MKEEEFIKRYSEAVYEKHLGRNRKWAERNPDKVRNANHEASRKGGRRYAEKLKYDRTGISGERARIRVKHANRYRVYKQIIAPGSQVHHSWRPGSSKYDGVALVEKDQHRHGIIDVIQILKGEITIFTEAGLRER